MIELKNALYAAPSTHAITAVSFIADGLKRAGFDGGWL
jgi:hypothetical protein